MIAVERLGQCADYQPIRAGVPLVRHPADRGRGRGLGRPRTAAKRPARSGRSAASPSTATRSSPPAAAGCWSLRRGRWADRARFLATRPAIPRRTTSIRDRLQLSHEQPAGGGGPGPTAACWTSASSSGGQFPLLPARPRRHARHRLHARAPAGRSTRWLTCITIDPAAFGGDPRRHPPGPGEGEHRVAPVWKPMHLQPVFADCRGRGGGVAGSSSSRACACPAGPTWKATISMRIVQTIRGRQAQSGRSGPPIPPLHCPSTTRFLRQRQAKTRPQR